MNKYLSLAIAALLAGSLAAQPAVPPQPHLEIWVEEDGTQGFLIRIAFPGTSDSAAEIAAREFIPRALAEKQWCLRGWSIENKQSVPVDRPKGSVITFSGTCK